MASNEMTPQVRVSAYIPYGAELADAGEGQTAGSMNMYREYFVRLQPWQRDTLDSILRQAAVPEGLQPPADTPWADHLQTLDDDKIGDFWRWNVETNREQNEDPQWLGKVAAYRKWYKSSVELRVATGELPEAALEVLPGVDTVPVVRGDLFSTALNDNGGYHFPAAGCVLGSVSDRLFAHEMGHEVVPQFVYQPLAEGVNETGALVIQNGNPGVIHPDQRYDTGTYRGQRIGMHAILTAGTEQIEQSLPLETCFDTSPDHASFNELDSMVSRAYKGTNIWKYHHSKLAEATHKLHESAPLVPGHKVADTAQEFAAYSIKCLGALKQGSSVGYVQGSLDTWAERERDELSTQLRVTSELPEHELQSVRLRSQMTGMLARNFRAGTAFLAD